MKKTNKFLLIALLVLTLTMSTVLFACNNGDPKIWKVTFDYNYTGAPSATVVDVNDKKTVAEPTPAPARPDYDFKGWFTDPACTAATAFVFTTAIKADTTLYAGWELIPVTTIWKVTFDYNYTGAPSATVVDVNDKKTVAAPTPAPTRPDYDFKGWFTNAAGTAQFVFTTAITADTTLYAGWELKPVFVPDPEIASLNFDSSVTALEGTWKVVKVCAGGSISDAVANAITLKITLELDPWELVEGIAYIHNKVYNVNGVMTFGLPAINAELAEDDIESYGDGKASWEDFSMGKVAPEDEFYIQPGPAIMKFGNDIRYYGLFLDQVAGISADINTKRNELIIGMNNAGQLLLGYSDKAIEFPEVSGNWTYCLIFDKA